MQQRSLGQATVEYIFILMIAVLLGFKITSSFAGLFQAQMGKVGHVLSSHLMVGVCKSQCFFGGYGNGYSGGP